MGDSSVPPDYSAIFGEDPVQRPGHARDVNRSKMRQLEDIFSRASQGIPAQFSSDELVRETVTVPTRDGTRLATDMYRPPGLGAFPVMLYRTPYGRRAEVHAATFAYMARRGFIVLAQDCRGTGDSDGDDWDYYMYEPDDGHDFVEWVSHQEWSGDFICSYGASYAAQTQWQMALHPRMSAIMPEVSGLGGATNQSKHHMFQNAYAKTVGRGSDRLAIPMDEMEIYFEAETMAGGYFHSPLFADISLELDAIVPGIRRDDPGSARRYLWAAYCDMTCSDRARIIQSVTGDPHVTSVSIDKSLAVFGQKISHDRHTLPRVHLEEAVAELRAPTLLRTGWYDWGLNDALDTWGLIERSGTESVRKSSRLIIAPSAHNMPGYVIGADSHPELGHSYATSAIPELLSVWTDAVRHSDLEGWPRVAYYLMGAGEWRYSTQWPPPEVQTQRLYLSDDAGLSPLAPVTGAHSNTFSYDPSDPTPTIGGSIVSYLYTPGSVDVSAVQMRPDVLTYSTPSLSDPLDVVGSLQMVLFASTTAEDTDFFVRLSDVFPDDKAVQLQSGMVRGRYQRSIDEPSALQPGAVCRFDVDMWATAHRFEAGHRLRIDISSSDFPRFERHSNRIAASIDAPLETMVAHQTIYRSHEHPSHLIFSVLPAGQTGSNTDG